jgi:hypothetical protein
VPPDTNTLWPRHLLHRWLFALAAAHLVSVSTRALSDDALSDSLPAEITGSGTIIDADSGQGVPGAKITIWEYEEHWENGLYRPTDFRHHECLSHADGKFEFTLPTDRALKSPDARTLVRFRLEVKHSQYIWPDSPLTRGAQLEVAIPPDIAAARKRTGSDQPVHELPPLKVIPGKAVTGILQSPEGKPVPGVKIYAFSSALLKQSIWNPNVVASRGDLGAIMLKKGRSISGQILDPDNKPLGGVYVHALPEFRFWPSNTSVRPQVSIARTTTTSADGTFSLAPLPTGEYEIQPREAASNLSAHYYLARQKIILAESAEPEPVTIRAIPTVLVSGHVTIPQSLLEAMREPIQARGFAGRGSPAFINAAQATLARDCCPARPRRPTRRFNRG